MNPKDRPIPFARIPVIQKTVELWLQDGIITPEGSPYISPITIVTKENGELRPCLDSREINKHMATRGIQISGMDFPGV